MVQNPDLLDGSKWNDEDIVISGISARLPNCDSVEEFQHKLLAKIDLITDEPRRFQNGLYGAIKRYGLLKDLSKFDAKFFNVHPKQAERMDPQIRGLLEVAFEATVDAGLHPEDLKGSKTGVVVGIASSETQDKWSQMPDKINGFEYTGCTRTMFANRVSYMLDLKGPSYSIDTASSTTLVAFQQAYDMIKDGVCDACFVCGTDLVLNPCVCLMFQCLNMLSPEGKCKAFDIGGDGYVRSEGVVAVLLQKAKSAKRVYAKVLAAGSNCDGYKDEGITFPSGAQQVKLFRRVAQLAGVDPSQINFMEAHGSATRVGDPQEMNAVTEVFVKGRKEPLRTGSIKSNMGHAEPASALSAVIKVCVAMESGILPPNLHYNIPNPDIPALLDGRLKVVTEPTPWDGGLVAVNSFGVGGANGHALLLSNKKIKNNTIDNIPRLVCISGVNESAVRNMLDKLNSLPRDPELYALLNNVYRKNIHGHDFRGYMVLSGNGVIDIKEIPNTAQSLCLVFPGVEGDWKATSADMFNLTEFQNSIKKCENALKSVANNINLKNILMTLNTEKSVLNVILGITALQIGVVDILKSLQLVPDYVIGFNIGEIASGYADARYSLEQAILSAFHIGALIQRYSYSSSIIRADVASNKYIPSSDISIIAQISSQCTLFSGPKQSIDNFSRYLNSKGVATKEIGSNALDIAGILKSSKNISKLAHDLEQVLSSANQPTKRWLTHAVHEPNLDTCASHLINSLTNFTPIQKAINTIRDSFVLEVGFGSSAEILQKSKCPGTSVFHGQADVYSFISTVGRLYNSSFQPQIQNLYPAVQFPVSHGTPMIQSMIEWDHSVNWNVVSFAPKEGRTAGEMEVVVVFNKEDFNFLPGNYLNCAEVFPKSFYIMLLWRAIGRLQVKPTSEIPLVIENISFAAETSIPDDGNVTFTVNIMNTSNKFEIWESGRMVATGQVNILPDISKELLPQKIFNQNSISSSSSDEIYKTDVYNDLNVKHYCYNDTFQQLESIDYQSNTAKVVNNNWCALLESFLQIALLKSDFTENSYSVVSFIRKIVLDPVAFKNKEVACIKYNKEYNVLRSDCLEIRGVKVKTQACIPVVKPKLESYKFVPFIARNVQNACEISLQMAIENWSGQNELKIAELSSYNTYDSLLTPKILNGNPLITTDITVYSSEPLYSVDELKDTNIKYVCKDLTLEPVDNNCHIVVASNVLSNTNLLDHVIKTVRTDGCIVLEENIEENVNIIEDTELQLVSYLTYRDKCFIVLKKVNATAKNTPYVISASNDSFEWIKNIQQISTQQADNILIVAKGVETHGILNFVRSLRAEVKNKNISIIIAEDETAPVFSVTCELYHDQLKSNYPVNVFKNGAWGTYLPLSLSLDSNTSTNNAYVGFDFDQDPIQIAYIKNNNNISKKDIGNVICEVHSASLSLKDQSLVKGKFSDVAADSKLGLEFSGYNGREKVFGLVAEGALASSVPVSSDFIWNVPKNWSMEEAATVPFSYALAYYALCVRGNLKEKSSALIVGANSIAIASIYIALQYQLNIFILLSEKSEKLLLKKLFPQIKDTQMIISKNNNFPIQISQRTSNKGVNILFDTLSYRKYNIRSYISSLSENGKLMFLDNEDISEELLGSAGNMRCITYHRITASCLFENDSVMKRISAFITNGMKTGAIQPLPYTLFSNQELNSALSYVTEGNDLYKAIINLKNENDSSNSTGKIFEAKPRVYFDSSKSYVILGATEGFGLYVTNWMISHGVCNLVLISVEKESNSENLKKIYLHKWKSLNTSIITLKLDTFNLKTCEATLNKALQLGSVDGIFDFTASKVLENKSIEILQENDFKNSKDHKLDFLKNMDIVSRKLCPQLRYFVSFSSVEFSYGIHGYSVNSYNNGVIQNIMKDRKNSNLCATLIQWGNIGESGSQVLYENTKSLDLASQQINSCLRVLHIFLENSEPILSSYVVSERSGNESYSKADAILEGVAKFLGIKDPSSVLPTLTMLELGLDSLIGTDIQQFMEINYGVTLSTQEVRELTFEKLRNLGESL